MYSPASLFSFSQTASNCAGNCTTLLWLNIGHWWGEGKTNWGMLCSGFPKSACFKEYPPYSSEHSPDTPSRNPASLYVPFTSCCHWQLWFSRVAVLLRANPCPYDGCAPGQAAHPEDPREPQLQHSKMPKCCWLLLGAIQTDILASRLTWAVPIALWELWSISIECIFWSILVWEGKWILTLALRLV